MGKVRGEATTFGQFIRAKRVALGLTLRQFCNDTVRDPGNHSRLERDIIPPPNDYFWLEHLGTALGMSKGDADWDYYMALAGVATRRIPWDIVTDAALVKMLPVFLCGLSSGKATDDVVDELVAFLRRNLSDRGRGETE